MLLVFLAIASVLIILAVWPGGECDEDLGICIGAIGIVALIACVIAIFCVWSGIKSGDVIDDRIAMYQEQNDKIETQIAECVSQYQQYESGVFKSVAPESAITLVSLYPELKSDSLVQAQIATYQTNNNTITRLRDDQIMLSVKRWWLYFGN